MQHMRSVALPSPPPRFQAHTVAHCTSRAVHSVTNAAPLSWQVHGLNDECCAKVTFAFASWVGKRDSYQFNQQGCQADVWHIFWYLTHVRPQPMLPCVIPPPPQCQSTSLPLSVLPHINSASWFRQAGVLHGGCQLAIRKRAHPQNQHVQAAENG
jgi:hypothetical protein